MSRFTFGEIVVRVKRELLAVGHGEETPSIDTLQETLGSRGYAFDRKEIAGALKFLQREAEGDLLAVIENILDKSVSI